jgi:hypothetical protein
MVSKFLLALFALFALLVLQEAAADSKNVLCF